MTFSSKSFFLKCKDFPQHVVSSYKEMRHSGHFSDVTLLCEDAQQFEAHRVILTASSQYLSNVLKRERHSHPMIYMRGLNAKDILAILDVIYYGEVKVNQEDLNQFLVLAEEFKLNGMSVVGDQIEIPSLNPPKKQEIILNEILTNNKPDIIIPNTLMKREIPISEPQILKENHDNELFSEGEKEILEEEIKGKKESKRKHRLDWEVANEYNTREEFELSE